MNDSMDRIEKYLTSNPVSDDDDRLLRDIAYDRLKEAMHSVKLESGDPLSENRLSKVLNISRTPVRGAIQQLVAEGLLQTIPGRAVVIAAHSLQQVSDAVHVRRLLEPEVMRLAAESLSEEAREQLQAYTEQLEAAAAQGDRTTWSRVDSQWHEILCDNCPNKLLGQMVLQARNHMHNEGVGAKVSDQYLLDGTAEHRLIVDLIMTNDGDGAAKAMGDHIDRLRNNLF